MAHNCFAVEVLEDGSVHVTKQTDFGDANREDKSSEKSWEEWETVGSLDDVPNHIRKYLTK